MTEDKSEQGNSKFDWSKWFQVLATGFVGLVGIYFTNSNSQQQEQNRISQMTTQLMSNREQSETEFRRNIFQPLIDKILCDTIPLTKRLIIFQVFQNNFNDLFNSRSLFDVLDDNAQSMIASEDSLTKLTGEYVHHKLISLAKRTSQAQQQAIGDEQSYEALLQEGNDFDTTLFRNRDAEESERGKTKKNKYEIHILLEKIEQDNIQIRMAIRENLTRWNILNNGQPFEVSYFDLPFTDNLLLPDKDRISVILENIIHEPNDTLKIAKLKIIHFPGDLITTGYRPSISTAKKLLQTANSE
jgi:hypothetical protein